MAKKLKKGYFVKGQFVAEGSDLDLVLRNPKQLDCVVDGLEDLTKAIQASLLPMLIDLHLGRDCQKNLSATLKMRTSKFRGRLRQYMRNCF